MRDAVKSFVGECRAVYITGIRDGQQMDEATKRMLGRRILSHYSKVPHIEPGYEGTVVHFVLAHKDNLLRQGKCICGKESCKCREAMDRFFTVHSLDIVKITRKVGFSRITIAVQMVLGKNPERAIKGLKDLHELYSQIFVSLMSLRPNLPKSNLIEESLEQFQLALLNSCAHAGFRSAVKDGQIVVTDKEFTELLRELSVRVSMMETKVAIEGSARGLLKRIWTTVNSTRSTMFDNIKKFFSSVWSNLKKIWTLAKRKYTEAVLYYRSNSWKPVRRDRKMFFRASLKKWSFKLMTLPCHVTAWITGELHILWNKLFGKDTKKMSEPEVASA